MSDATEVENQGALLHGNRSWSWAGFDTRPACTTGITWELRMDWTVLAFQLFEAQKSRITVAPAG